MLRKFIGAALFFGRFFFSFSNLGYAFKHWSWPDVEMDFEGHRWLVTGASGGLGLATANAANSHRAQVIVVASSQDQSEQTEQNSATGTWIPIQCDLSRRDEIDRLVQRLIRQKQTLDVLVNNACDVRHEFSETPDGVETMFATNLLNHYYLTEKLIAAEILHKKSLVINVCSDRLYRVPLLVEALNAASPGEHQATRVYALQKRAQSILNGYWQTKYRRKGPRFYLMHPGWVDAQENHHPPPMFQKIWQPFLRTCEQGADTILWLAQTRPTDTRKLWFDRKPRPLHVYEFTRTSSNSQTRLVAFLDSFVAE